MKKRLIIIAIIIISIGLVSLYATFALNDNHNLDDSDSDINLSYVLNNESDMSVSVGKYDEKYVDMILKNNYKEKVKYGVYYKVNDMDTLPLGVNIIIDNNSVNSNEEIIKPNEEKIVTVIIKNDSDNDISISLGSVIGFVQGDINALLDNDMILIK